MSKLEKEFYNDSKHRIKKLEDETEELKAFVTEMNSGLKVPCVKDKGKTGLEFSLADDDSGILYVYLGEKLVGQITLE